MKTKHQSINQESVNNVEVQDWWVQQALTIHIFWEKIKTSCSIDGTQAGETEIMWVMRVAIFAVGGMATFMALTIPTIYGLWWLSHSWSFSLKNYFWLAIITDYQFAGLFVLIWSMSSSFLRWPEKSHYIYKQMPLFSKPYTQSHLVQTLNDIFSCWWSSTSLITATPMAVCLRTALVKIYCSHDSIHLFYSSLSWYLAMFVF